MTWTTSGTPSSKDTGCTCTEVGRRGIYEAQFAQVPGGWRIIAAVVEGDRSSYRRHDDACDTTLLEAFIDGKLLGRYDGPGHERLARIRAELGMT